MEKLSFRDMRKIAKRYGAKLIYCKDNGLKDGGASTNDIIWIYPSVKQLIKEISFWHELGHIINRQESIKSNRNYCMSTLSSEGCAWEIGLIEAAKHGRKWGYNSEQLRWARKQLASYVGGEYDDLVYNKEG